MEKVKKGVGLSVQALIFICAALGILLQCGAWGEKWDFSVLNYFTLMSNVGCCLYSLAAVIWGLRGREGMLLPQLKGALLVAITATGMVYHFMLHGRFQMQGTILLSNLLLHYAVPLLFVLQWLLFDRKGNYSWRAPLLWLCFPLCYFLYVLVRVALGGVLGPFGSKYPYYFMDVEALGWGKVLCINLGIAAALLLLGYGIVALDRLLGRRQAARAQKHDPGQAQD